MGGPIIISYDELSNASKGLAFVKEQLGGINAFSEKMSGEIGDPNPDFRTELHDFEASWDDNRKDILKVVGDMGDAAAKIVADWKKFDEDAGNQLAQGVNGDGSKPAPKKPSSAPSGTDHPAEAPSGASGQPGSESSSAGSSNPGGPSGSSSSFGVGDDTSSGGHATTPYQADHKGSGGSGLSDDPYVNPADAASKPDNVAHPGDALHQNQPYGNQGLDDSMNLVDSATGLPIKAAAKRMGYDPGPLVDMGPGTSEGLQTVTDGVTGKVLKESFQAIIKGH